MLTLEQIQSYCDDIVRKFDPEKIILFGSYAYGTPRIDSDLDLLVIMPVVGHPIEKSVDIIRATNPKFGIDLLVRPPGYLERRAQMGDIIMREVAKKGKVLYERSNT